LSTAAERPLGSIRAAEDHGWPQVRSANLPGQLGVRRVRPE